MQGIDTRDDLKPLTAASTKPAPAAKPEQPELSSEEFKKKADAIEQEHISVM